jgi:hypothetical protein
MICEVQRSNLRRSCLSFLVAGMGLAAAGPAEAQNPYQDCRHHVLDGDAAAFHNCFQPLVQYARRNVEFWVEPAVNATRHWKAFKRRGSDQYALAASDCAETRRLRTQLEQQIQQLVGYHRSLEAARALWRDAVRDIDRDGKLALAQVLRSALDGASESAALTFRNAEVAVKLSEIALADYRKANVEDRCAPVIVKPGCTYCSNGGTISGTGGDNKKYCARFAPGQICPRPYDFAGRNFNHYFLDDQPHPNAAWGVEGGRVECDTTCDCKNAICSK